MSHEGFLQCICENGHYSTSNEIYRAYENHHENDLICEICKAKVVWENCVDQTNGPSQGEVPFDTLKEKFLVHPAVIEVCNLGHAHEKSVNVFRIPTREETEQLRVYFDEEIY